MKKKPAAKNGKLEVINLKIPGAERKRLQAKARRHAKGNLSAWLRCAGREYVPPKKFLVPLKVHK